MVSRLRVVTLPGGGYGGIDEGTSGVDDLNFRAKHASMCSAHATPPTQLIAPKQLSRHDTILSLPVPLTMIYSDATYRFASKSASPAHAVLNYRFSIVVD
jgi:hypothetical protein